MIGQIGYRKFQFVSNLGRQGIGRRKIYRNYAGSLFCLYAELLVTHNELLFTVKLAGHDETHNFRGTFEDAEDPGIAIEFLHRVVMHVAVTA
mgnify:CR=1 FL=1